jgi:hypothetical protein
MAFLFGFLTILLKQLGLMDAISEDRPDWQRIGREAIGRKLKGLLRMHGRGELADEASRRRNRALADFPSEHKFHVSLNRDEAPRIADRPIITRANVTLTVRPNLIGLKIVDGTL